MAKISVELNNIKNATFGREVRGSIHDGIEKINEEVEGTTGRQERLEKIFDNLVGSGDMSAAEVIEARVDADGTVYGTLGNRLNSSDVKVKENTEQLFNMEQNFDDKMDEIAKNINDKLIEINNSNIELEERIDNKINASKINKNMLVFKNERVETLEIINIPEHEHYEINLTVNGYSNSMNIFINGALIESVNTSNTGLHYSFFSCFIKNNEIFYSIDLKRYDNSASTGQLLNAITFNKTKQLNDGLKSLKITHNRNEPSDITLNILGY